MRAFAENPSWRPLTEFPRRVTLPGMPELPDVEVYLEALRPRIGGEELEAAAAGQPASCSHGRPAPGELRGPEVTDLRRLGKRVVIGLRADCSW